MLQRLELKIPPLLLLLMLGAAAYLLAQWLPSAGLEPVLAHGCAIVLAILAGAVILAAVYEFRRASTTVNPTAPDTSSAIVSSGIFAYSRNPMYLGFALLLAAYIFWLNQLLALLLVPALVLYLNRFQIVPEEKALAAKFGQAYQDYLNKVRRWL